MYIVYLVFTESSYMIYQHTSTASLQFIDLFCGIGGFRYAMEQVSAERGYPVACVFSSDIDPHCREAHTANFGESPQGDITKCHGKDIPDHDILLAGFPCQPFSIIGQMKVFDKGTKKERYAAQKAPKTTHG